MHVLTSINPASKTAICSVDGPVKVYSNGKKSFTCALHQSRKVRKAHGLNWYERQEFIGTNPVCAICDKRVIGRDAHVDHDHKTGVIRGILCAKHNRALGLFGDDTDLLLAAGRYLNK